MRARVPSSDEAHGTILRSFSMRARILTVSMRGMALLGAAALAACSNGTPNFVATPVTVGTRLAAEQVVSRAVEAMPRTLDPSLSTDVAAATVIGDLFEGLTALGVDGRIVPGVASSWEVSPDGKTWVFHLRPNARWSNGKPVTAADFIYAWRREVDPKTAAEYSQALTPIVNALAIATGKAPVESLGVVAPDPHTLRISLNAPTPYLLFLLADSYLQPLPRATIERYGDGWTRPGHMVSDGPFVLTGLVIGDRITLTKNPFYWDAASVHLTRVTYFPLDDNETQVNRFLAGDVQYTDRFTTSQYTWLKSRLGDQVRTGLYFGTMAFAFNVSKPPFAANRDLRLALTMAIDRKILAEKIYQGIAAPAYSLIPPLPGYTVQVPAWASWSAERRHAEARRLYAAAGYSAAHPLHVELDYPTDPSRRDLFDALAAMWRINLGADVEPYNEEFRVLLQDDALHKTHFFWDAWEGDYPDPFTFLQLFQTGFDQNDGEYSNPTFDGLLMQATRQSNVALRYRYFEQAESLLNQDAPYVPFLYYSAEHLVKPYLKGVQWNLEDLNPSRYMYVLEHTGR